MTAARYYFHTGQRIHLLINKRHATIIEIYEYCGITYYHFRCDGDERCEIYYSMADRDRDVKDFLGSLEAD